MVDFIEEVEEKLRSERYMAIGRRVLPWFLIALAAVVIGWLAVWGYRTWQDRNIGAASLSYDKGVQALGQGDETGAFVDFGALGRSGPAGYRSLALMQQGNIRLAAGKDEEAAGLYDQAAKAAPNAIFHDLAELKAALALMDSAPYPQLRTRLAALIGDDRPYSLKAREALALAKLAAGKTAEARGDFQALILTLGVTDAMKARAQTAIALIDSGQAKFVPSVARIAATLPPSAQPSIQGAGEQGAPSADQAQPNAGDAS
ncbi:MAG: tetratricopeptide repeat protein [Caulobacteraceae bacterium]